MIVPDVDSVPSEIYLEALREDLKLKALEAELLIRYEDLKRRLELTKLYPFLASIPSVSPPGPLYS